jgi:hypothetical protein
MKNLFSASLFSAASTAALLASAAHAASYVTEFTGTDIGSFAVARVEVAWTTSVAVNNPVAVADLSDLSFSFYNDSDVQVYIDNAIVSGVVQPIGGVTRTLADLTFNATSGVSIQSLDNDLNQIQFGASTGETYNLYGVVGGGSPAINIAFYDEGQFQEDATFNITGQVTSSAVPEPSSAAALAGLAGIAFAAARRRRS